MAAHEYAHGQVGSRRVSNARSIVGTITIWPSTVVMLDTATP